VAFPRIRSCMRLLPEQGDGRLLCGSGEVHGPDRSLGPGHMTVSRGKERCDGAPLACAAEPEPRPSRRLVARIDVSLIWL